MGKTAWGIKGSDGFVRVCYDEREARRENRVIRGVLVKRGDPEWEEVDTPE